MLEVAQRIAKYKPEYDVVFVAFGAEEVGLKGSAYFANNMAPADKARAIAMVNFDSLIVGDKLYIHAGANEKTWARDEMLRLIRLRNLPIEIQPGLNPDYPAGFTPDGFSDYTAFNQAGIPVVAFESTNWEIGDLDGYEQTEEYGSFWHTPNDTLSIIESYYPDAADGPARGLHGPRVRVPEASEPVEPACGRAQRARPHVTVERGPPHCRGGPSCTPVLRLCSCVHTGCATPLAPFALEHSAVTSTRTGISTRHGSGSSRIQAQSRRAGRNRPHG